MTLQASGAISFSNINVELGRSATATLSMNDEALRTLSGVASGTVTLNNCYGKTNIPGYALWSWGSSYYGESGQGTTSSSSSPIQVGALTTWRQVSASDGYSSFGIRTNGTLWSWGINSYGQLCQGDISSRSSPVQVGALTNWSKVDASGNIVIMLKTDGTLWTCGVTPYNLSANSSPVQVGSLTTWSSVSCGNGHLAAIKNDGTLWTWGGNSLGALGLNDRTNRSSPTQVGSLTNWKSVSCGLYNTMAVKTDGTLWAWGANGDGQLGQSDIVYRSSPIQVGSLTTWAMVSISSASYTVMAIKTDGTLWAWGTNTYGQLGLSDIVKRSSPIQVGSLTNWSDIDVGPSYCHAIKTDGTLWCWGNNSGGVLGINSTSPAKISSPVQIGSLTNWKSVSVGYNHALAIKT